MPSARHRDLPELSSIWPNSTPTVRRTAVASVRMRACTPHVVAADEDDEREIDKNRAVRFPPSKDKGRCKSRQMEAS
jgi:hypothetical protein